MSSLALLMVAAAERAGVRYSDGTYTASLDGSTYTYVRACSTLWAEQPVGLRCVRLGEAEGERLVGRLARLCRY